MKFSERKGFKKVKKVFQIDDINIDTRYRLWNAIFTTYWKWVKRLDFQHSDIKTFFEKLWDEYFRYPIDNLDSFWFKVNKRLREYFFGCKWFEIYDFIEFLFNNFPNYSNVNSIFKEKLNRALEEELCNYRLVGDKIVEITSEMEIIEIEEALESPNPIEIHLKTALNMVADRKEPDYRNSIKESISAVESLCKMITKKPKATLGQALKIITDNVEIHPALVKAFDKLYGYTSDEDGIRHSLLDVSKVNFEDAKFMLVSCSAFINYLKEKASKVKIEL